MRRCLTLLAIVFLAYIAALPAAHAVILVESAQLGPRTDQGAWIGKEQFVGTRFHLNSLTQLQTIGGAIPNSNGSIFGAVYQLSSPTSFPAGNPFDAAPLAVTVFTVGYALDWDIRVPLQATLAPGDYALVFGSGLYGATGSAVATTDNIDVTGSSCLWWNGWNPASTGWVNWDPGFNGPIRLVAEGIIVPEPATGTLLAVAATLALARSRKHPQPASSPPVR